MAAGTPLPLIGRGADQRQRLRQRRGAEDRPRPAPAGLHPLCHARHRGFPQPDGLPVTAVNKVAQGSPHVVDLIRGGQVQLILNTPLGPEAHTDGAEIRAAAIFMDVPLLTTLSAATAAVSAIRAVKQKELTLSELAGAFRA